MEKEFIVSDESINCYGYRVLTSGIDLTDFLKNPLALWNHTRASRGLDDEVLPIGNWKDPKKKAGELTMTFVSDDSDEFAEKIAKKIENGVLRACSMGIEPIEWSEDPKYLLPGQSRATVTKCVLKEISIVDIPANKNAVALYNHEGFTINLSEGNACPIPLINPNVDMEVLKSIGVSLGLGDNLNEAQLVTLFKKQEGQINQLNAELKTLKEKEAAQRQEEVKNLLDAATAENRIDGTQRLAFEKLFVADYDSAKNLLAATTAKATLVSFTQNTSTETGGVKTHEGLTFSQLRKDKPDVLLKLKENNETLFNQLYESEFGKAYKA